MTSLRVTAAYTATVLIACTSTPAHEPGGPFYFASFGCSYSIPLCPVEPIQASERGSYAAYVEAYFNSGGKITRFIKHSDGKVQFEHEYHYDDRGELNEYELRVPGQEPQLRSAGS